MKHILTSETTLFVISVRATQLIRSVFILLVLMSLTGLTQAQSTDRDNPTRLKSNEISGLIDSESRGHFYYYSFMAGPGEVSIMLTVEPGRPVESTVGLTSVGFSLYDRNAEALTSKSVSTYSAGGPGQAVARVEVTRRQSVVLGINIPEGSIYRTVGGKYRLRINGAVDLVHDRSDTKDDSRGLTQADVEAALRSKPGECLPKQGTLIVKMKDGTKRIIDLSEALEVTIVP